MSHPNLSLGSSTCCQEQGPPQATICLRPGAVLYLQSLLSVLLSICFQYIKNTFNVGYWYTHTLHLDLFYYSFISPPLHLSNPDPLPISTKSLSSKYFTFRDSLVSPIRSINTIKNLDQIFKMQYSSLRVIG